MLLQDLKVSNQTALKRFNLILNSSLVLYTCHRPVSYFSWNLFWKWSSHFHQHLSNIWFFIREWFVTILKVLQIKTTKLRQWVSLNPLGKLQLRPTRKRHEGEGGGVWQKWRREKIDNFCVTSFMNGPWRIRFSETQM